MEMSRSAESGIIRLPDVLIRGTWSQHTSPQAMFKKICIIIAGITPITAISQDGVKPLDFPDKWTLADPKAWAWEKSDAGPVLSLKQQSEFISEVRRPRNLAWFDGRTWGSFRLTAEVRLDLFNDGNNDVCVAFGQTSETKFYYAHLGETADGVHLHLHMVNDADRQPITKTRVDSLPWKPEHWHKLVIERDLDAGTIRVWFDGNEVLAAVDRTLGEGKIGLGSFDDLGSFRAVTITQVKADG